MRVGHCADRSELVDLVNCTHVGGLHQVHGAGLVLVCQAYSRAKDCVLQGLGVNFPVWSIDRHKFGAAAEKTGGVAFRGVDVRQCTAIDSAKGRA